MACSEANHETQHVLPAKANHNNWNNVAEEECYNNYYQ